MKFTPRPYQPIAISHFLSNDRCALFAKPGMGKSSSTLAALDGLYLCGESHPTLVLAPLRVARDTWPREAKKWRDFRHIDIAPIIGTEKQRLAALNRDVSVYTTNYEQLPWLIDHYGDRWPFRNLVSDESTRIKNTRISTRTHPKTGKVYLQQDGGGKRSGMLAKIAFKHIKRFWELTGSPAAKSLTDLWGQLWFLDQGHRLGRNYGAFEARWFERVMAHPNDKYGELRPKAGAEDEIKARIADLCLALDPKDWFPDLQEPLRIRVPVYLPDSVRDLYQKMKRELYVELGKHGVEAPTTAAAMMKCRQIAAGALFEQDASGKSTKEFHDLHDEKLQALESIYEESGGTPLLVAYWFKPDLAKLKRAFPKGADLSTDAGLKRFMAGEAPYGFAQPQSIGHGYDGMQDVTHIIVFYTGDYNFEYREQIIERIGPVRQLQSGHNRKVLIYDIVAAGTIDEPILEVCETKCSLQEALFADLRRPSFA